MSNYTIDTVNSLLERYRIAYKFGQSVNEEAVIESLGNWSLKIIGTRLPVRFVKNEQEVLDAIDSARAIDRASASARAIDSASAIASAIDRAIAIDSARAIDSGWRARYAIYGIATKNEQIYNEWIDLFIAFENGLWYFYVLENEIVATPIPSVCLLDDRNRLHSVNTPAFEWLTTKQYWVHGVEVPANIIVNPQSITVQMIRDESNAEVRRIMIDQYERDERGKYLRDSGAEKVAHDPRFGTLYRAYFPDDEDYYGLHVINSTPEPDGTYREFIIRINPRAYNGDAAEIPQAAAASTFFVKRPGGEFVPMYANWQDYHPVKES